MEPRIPKSQLSLEDSLNIYKSLQNSSDPKTEADEIFQKAVLNIPNILNAISQLSGNLDTSSLEGWYRTNKPFDMAFNHASLALGAAADALSALYSQVFLAKTLTSYAPLVLIRQACECALLSRWLTDDLSASSILERGFAIEWKNAKEADAFHRNMLDAGAVDPKAIEGLKARISKRMNDALDIGHEYKLLKLEGANFVPIKPFVGFKNLFKDVNSSTEFNNMVWAYNLLSGVNHGLEWALMSVVEHKIIQEFSVVNDQGVAVGTGVVNHSNTPKVESFTFPLHLALLQVSKAISNLNTAQLIKTS